MIDLLDEQGIAHRLWPLTDSAAVESVARGLAGVTAVLADGHHRLAAAAQLADRGDGWRHTLAVLFDAEHLGPRLRAVHRLLHPSVTDPVGRLDDIEGVTVVPREADPDDLGMAIGELAGSLRRGTARRFGIVTDGQLWRVEVNDAIAQRRLAQHDVPAPLRLVDLVLAEEVLFPALGLRQGAGEPVTEPERLAERLTGPQRGREVLLLLAPPTVGQVYAVAQAGLRMPPKSTWFAPKPRAGLLMRRPDLR